MKTRISVALLLAAAVLPAQGPRGPQSPASPNHQASNLNMAAVQTITGPVGAVNIAYGMQYPSVLVNKALIKIAPAWYLLQNDFEMAAGDSVTVVAAPSMLAGDDYFYAVEITNTTRKTHIILRDSAGVPLWSGPAGGRGNPDAPRNGGGCVDPASIVTASGVIEKLSMGVGIQMPAMALKTSGGQFLSIKLGPEHILLEADLELQEGQNATVRYAQASCTEEYIALQVTNSAGVTVVLRHDDGTPAWR